MTQWVIEHPCLPVAAVGYPHLESWQALWARACADDACWRAKGLHFRPLRSGESYHLAPVGSLAFLDARK